MEKSLSEWEQQKGWIIPSISPDKKMTEEEFDLIPSEHKHGVDHKTRVAFLKKNGYAVTRDNMLNSNLSTVDNKKG